MNELSCESFINWCDDMYIADEGISDIGKAIKSGLKTMLDTFIKICKEIGRRIKDAFRVLTGKETSKEAEVNAKYLKLLESNKKALKTLQTQKLETEAQLAQALRTLQNTEKTLEALSKENGGLKEKTEHMRQTIKDCKELMADQDVEISRLNDEGQKLLKHALDNNDKYLKAKAKNYDLEKKIENAAKEAEQEIDHAYEWAKGRIKSGSNGIVKDYWGIVEMSFKASPKATALIGDVNQMLTTMASSPDKIDTNKLSDLEEKVADCYSTCKSIFRYSETDHAADNPKEYSHAILNDFYKGLQKETSILSNMERNLRKVYESNIVNNPLAAGNVEVSGTKNDQIVNRVFKLSIKLVSVLQSYANLVYKVKAQSPESRAKNMISYSNYKGYYNYGKTRRHSDRRFISGKYKYANDDE
jgi:hypothetical protein